MTRLALSLWLASALLAGAQSAISNLVLNPREVMMVPVATDRLSLICFPSAISHLEGAYLTTDAEPPARFQINYKPGNSYFSVRALLTNATATVTIIWNRKAFIFELISSANPLLALNLVEPVVREITIPDHAPRARRLLGILDTAKSYSLLRAQHPEEVADVAYFPKKDRWDFGMYELLLEEVFHFKTEDTLVYRVVFRNKQNAPMTYQPQGFRIQVGTQVFYAAIADGDGIVPPLGSAPVYFAITSRPDGSRLGLSPQNQFSILFTTPSLAPFAPPPTPQNSPSGSNPIDGNERFR